MNFDRLNIYAKDGGVRCSCEKWTFYDRFMGEQYISFSINSPVPIQFEIGDYCEFRGEAYYLNYIPSCTQNARSKESGDSFTYENVKLNSHADELTRCEILDVVLTSGEHSAAYGTNYTGSNQFTLDCFGTTFVYQGQTIYYCPARVLADCILANLIRLYGTTDGNPYDGSNGVWKIYMDDSKCQTDDKVLSPNAWTATQALAEMHNTFELDFCIRGTKIIIGDVSSLVASHPELAGIATDLTDVEDNGNLFYFGYGKGNNTLISDGKGLFQIRRIANSEQQVITRLRAMGSTKNMPYRYYNKNYALPQTMFVTNLQLPQTFLPYEGVPEKKPADEYNNKSEGNAARDAIYDYQDGEPTGHYAVDGIHNLRHVLGDSNDAYIDKNDDAGSCSEGIREASAKWDGSNSELPEIYPTIKEGTYTQLRANNIPDQDDVQGPSAFPNYGGDERIDEILEVGELCNYGDGIMPDESEINPTSIKVETLAIRFTHSLNQSSLKRGDSYTTDLFQINQVQEKGRYIYGITTTQIRWQGEVEFKYSKNQTTTPYARVGLSMTLVVSEIHVNNGDKVELTRYTYNTYLTSSRDKPSNSSYETLKFDLIVPNFNDGPGTWSNDHITVSQDSRIACALSLRLTSYENSKAVPYSCTHSLVVADSENTKANIIWSPFDATATFLNTPFTLYVKDFGVDFTEMEPLNDEDMVISMTSGQCMGRDFTVNLVNTTKAIVGQKKCYLLELKRTTDDGLGAYFPSRNNKILAGDRFVVTGITLPHAYIRMAEVRLLEAATEHLADNCETKFTYQPMIDNIYLRRDIDKCLANNDITKSIYWRLYAGMRFSFRGIPQTDNALDPLPIANITIEQVTINMGEDDTPHVEVTLNSDVEQSTTQKIQTSIDRVYGSIFNSGSINSPSANNAMFLQLLQTEGEKRFVSKLKEDTAVGRIDVENGITIGEYNKGYTGGAIVPENDKTLVESDKALFRDVLDSPEVITNNIHNSGTAVAGLLGSGFILAQGLDGTSSLNVDRLTVRQTMNVMELLIEKVRATGGTIIVSAANGKIKEVYEGDTTYTITFEQTNEFVVGDLIRCATFNGLNQKSYWVEIASVTEEGDIVVNKSDFEGEIPEEGDECVQMGNTLNTSRQGVISISAAEADNGNPMINVYDNVSSKSLSNCLRARLGDLEGIYDSFFGEHQPQGYGLYSDNAYLKGNFILANGEDIGVKFNILQDHISSVVEGGIQMLTNGDFTQGTAGWDGYITDENDNDVPMGSLGSVGKAGSGNDAPFVYVGNSLFTAAMPPYRIEDKEGRLAMWVDLKQLSYSTEYMINTDTINANSDITLSFWVYVEAQTSFTVAIGTISQTVQLSGDDYVYKWVQFKYSGKWGTNHALVFNNISDVWISGVQLYVPSTSLISQSASEIVLKLNNTGININDGTITLDADKVEVSDDLVVKKLNTKPERGYAQVAISGSMMKVFGENNPTTSLHANIEFGVDENGYAVLSYYDNNGRKLYDLGVRGLIKGELAQGSMIPVTVDAISRYDYIVNGVLTTIYLYTPNYDGDGLPTIDDYNSLNGTEMNDWFDIAQDCDNRLFLTDAKATALSRTGTSPNYTYTNIVDTSKPNGFYEASGDVELKDDNMNTYYGVEHGNPNDPENPSGQALWQSLVNADLAETYPDPSNPPSLTVDYTATEISGTPEERYELANEIKVKIIARFTNGQRSYLRVWYQYNSTNDRFDKIGEQQDNT